MVVGFTFTYAINAYHHWCCEFEYLIGTRCTTSCDKVCQWLATGQWFSPGPNVSSTNKTDCHDMAFVCSTCGKAYSTNQNLARHSETHQDPKACHCGEVFHIWRIKRTQTSKTWVQIFLHRLECPNPVIFCKQIWHIRPCKKIPFKCI